MVDWTTVAVSVILSLMAALFSGNLREEIQRRRESGYQKKQEKVDWYKELYQLLREAYLTAVITGHIKQNLTESQIEQELLDSQLQILDNALEIDSFADVIRNIESQKQVYQEYSTQVESTLDEQLQNEMEQHYTNLKKHTADPRVEMDEALTDEVSKALTACFHLSMYPDTSKFNIDLIGDAMATASREYHEISKTRLTGVIDLLVERFRAPR